jgi:hypothetical protein
MPRTAWAFLAVCVLTIASIGLARAQENEAATEQIWSIQVFVISPGITGGYWTFNHSTRELCEAAREHVQAKFYLDDRPHCQPIILPMKTVD